MRHLKIAVGFAIVFMIMSTHATATTPPQYCPLSEELIHQEFPQNRLVCGRPDDNCVKIGGQYHCPARQDKDPHRCTAGTVRQVALNFAGKPYVACAPLSQGCFSLDPLRNSFYDCRSVKYQPRTVTELSEAEGEGQSQYADLDYAATGEVRQQARSAKIVQVLTSFKGPIVLATISSLAVVIALLVYALKRRTG